jgi:hypothetical protein
MSTLPQLWWINRAGGRLVFCGASLSDLAASAAPGVGRAVSVRQDPSPGHGWMQRRAGLGAGGAPAWRAPGLGATNRLD